MPAQPATCGSASRHRYLPHCTVGNVKAQRGLEDIKGVSGESGFEPGSLIAGTAFNHESREAPICQKTSPK
jgi:hypothetical protein